MYIAKSLDSSRQAVYQGWWKCTQWSGVITVPDYKFSKIICYIDSVIAGETNKIMQTEREQKPNNNTNHFWR